MKEYNGLEIAVIGMSGRFSGSNDIDVFWKNLKEGIESIEFFSDEELIANGEDKGLINHPLYVKANSYLKDKEFFDSAFFNYRPDEAKLMDPQMRIFHECVWNALEDAGCNVQEYDENIGLFAGGSSNLNWMNYVMISSNADLVDGFTVNQLMSINYLCARVAYSLNLRGPSIYIDTTCSTSLVAIQKACMSLLLQECKIAVAGGVSVTAHSKKGYLYQEGMINSKDGHCRTFDKDASGTIGGEGAGVVVLKKLTEAIKDKDHIYAIVKGSSVNNDGAEKMSFAAPSVSGQSRAIIKARKMAKVEPESISYLEAHGTGTALGDPIEVEALNFAFGKSKKKYCALGSVKTNIGHLDAAAGVAGFIKTVLAIKHRQIPPSLNYKSPNPEINFFESPFYVNTELAEWKSDKYPLRAGVSSFGQGGTNAHVILEEAPPETSSPSGRSHQLLSVSAKTLNALRRNIENLKNFLDRNKDKNLADIAYTLKVGRGSFAYRKTIVCKDHEDAIKQLSSINIDESLKPLEDNTKSEVVFMFPGQGSQYINMCADLYNSEEAFRSEIDTCFDIVKRKSGKDLKKILFSKDKGLINETEYAQPILFVIEYGIARLLMHWGIKPDIMIGHSIGEYVAACLSGVFTLEDTLSLVVKRGELMQQMSTGSMLSVSISEAEIAPFLKKHKSISLAAVNSSSSCVVSGSRESINSFKSKIEKAGFLSKEIHTSHAFHSHMMDGMLADFEDTIKKTRIYPQQLPFISNLTGKRAADSQLSDPKYWLDHLRYTVKFSKGIEEVMLDKHVLFVEAGPGKTLGSFVRANESFGDGHKIINLIRHANETKNDTSTILSGLGKLWLNGKRPDWQRFYTGQDRRKVSLPTYSFDKIMYPVNVDAAKMVSEMVSDRSLIRNDITNWFYTPTWKISKEIPASSGLEPEVRILVFSDNCGVSDGFISKLKQAGGQVIQVQIGDEFDQVKPDVYVINPETTGDYKKLFKSLSRSNRLPDQILHSWGIQDDNDKRMLQATSRLEYITLYSLLNVTKALQRSGTLKEVTVLTNGIHNVLGQQDPSAPSKSPFLGLLKVIGQENPEISTGHIDISLSEFKDDQSLLSKLYSEILHSNSGKVVSYRASCRWTQVYESVKVKPNNSPENFRDQGVYLITGGLGKFGYTISKYLSKGFSAKLILIGREALPEKEVWNAYLNDRASPEGTKEKIKKILSIEDQGGEVLYLSCDISSSEEFSKVLEISEKKYGKLNGVFHAAGVTNGHSISALDDLDKEDFEIQFSSKVEGLMTLQKALSNQALDFCLLTSSLASVLGGLRFGAYASANTFMDYFVQSHKQDDLLKNWICVNFDSLSFDHEINDAVNIDELPDVINYVLSKKELHQLVVSTRELQTRLDQWINKSSFYEKLEEEEASSDIEQLEKFIPEKGHSVIESRLKKLWQKFFGRPNIDLDDDFFEIGGDSLKALTMIALISKEFHVDVSLVEFFEQAVLRNLSAFIEGADITGHSDIKKAPEKNYYTLSSAQRRLYILYELDRDSLAYNIPQVVKLEGHVDREKVEDTFKKLIARHESLRTSIVTVDDAPFQQVMDEAPFSLEYYESEASGFTSIIKRFIKPFNLSKPPFIRGGLIKLSTDVHLLMIDLHHIISDGVSQGILIKDFMALYKKEKLSALRLQYKDYAEWQQSAEQRALLAGQREFWKKEFAEEVSILDLPADHSRPLVKSDKGHNVLFTLNKEETENLRKMGDEVGATMFMTVFSVFNILLSKLSGQNDITVGTPVAGRDHADLEEIMGVFVNTLAIRNKVDLERDFMTFLLEVKQKTLACFSHQSFQYEELIEELSISRDTGRNPLFDVMFTYQNFTQDALVIPGLRLQPYDFSHYSAKVDLELSVVESDNELQLYFEYSTDLFERERIEQFFGYFHRIVIEVTSAPDRPLSAIDILSAEERKQIFDDFNNTDVSYPLDKTFIELFEEQVRQYSSSIAAFDHDKELSYLELNEQANKLANTLLSKGLTVEMPVVVLCERSVDMLAGILGIFKSGGTYIPLSVEYPVARIEQVLEDARPKFLMTTSSILNKEVLATLSRVVPGLQIICMDKWDGQGNSVQLDQFTVSVTSREEWQQNISKNPLVGVQPANLAYILYTSGSTGVPKGVMIEHRGMLNHLLAKRDDLRLSADSIVSQNASETFDISIWQFLSALIVGGKTIIYSRERILEPEKFLHQLHEDQITILEVVPSYLSVLLGHLEELEAGNLFTHLSYLLVTGETLQKKQVERWLKLYPHIKMVNAYGPTEASDDITHCIIEEVPQTTTVPIGRVLPNLHIYIIDEYMKLCPVGVKGEIVVSGIGVGRGYLNQPGKTAEVFLDDPFAPGEAVRMYRTGDVGRWLPDGNIEFFGRKDHQVKINGHRIELGEIENCLTEKEEITEAVVLTKYHTGAQYMVAYFVSEISISVEELRNFLLGKLPEYMLPSYFVHMEELPLTQNGKVDRKKLPDPEIVAGEDYVAPSSDIEKVLVEIWSEVLNIEKEVISVSANFFELGGHSLVATTLVNKISKRFEMEFKLTDIFTRQDIKMQAAFIELNSWLFKSEMTSDDTIGITI
ncbi:Long-chain-fatty-acid--CoA ligase [Fulvivirga imtechensis AK7]|uniref:Long-chain-fatty-acid--CoA ligase n=1 Tax=Fulvivirga imtechensis AK7 TaxID=1237149 RepID=L8JYK4_9BACT|nr:hybrid non-ribosomal peptide synthetase/type I polyketide synthase [Fulvivirga imtechensis]ELR72267.1 Long-chain-fatty-acid--CoA ligase [Fulvivirga imtechensis AK7]